MKQLEGYKKAFVSLSERIREGEVNEELHDTVTAYINNGQLSGVQMALQKALYIRVSGEKTGYYYTQNLDEEPEEALKKAYENSIYSEKTEKELIRTECEERNIGSAYANSNVPQLSELAAGLAKRIIDSMDVDAEKIEYQASLKAETYGQHTVNSYGLDVSFTHPVYIFHMDVNVSDSEGTYSADVMLAASDYEKMNAEQAGKELSLKCKAQMGEAVKIESGKYPVILGNSVVYYLFGTGWQLFSGCKYTENTTCMKGKLKEKVASSCFSVTDKNGADGNGFPMFADSEGVIGSDTKIIEKGLFLNPLHNISSAFAMGTKSTGNAGRRPLLFGNIATDILVTPKNFCICPGDSDMEEMIDHMGNGILITESFDIFHTIDIASGDFSIPCKGILIKDGKAAGRVSSLMMTGNVKELLLNIQEVGKEFIQWPMAAIENYGIGTCPLRLDFANISCE